MVDWTEITECYNLGVALLQTSSLAPALPPEGGFGTPQGQLKWGRLITGTVPKSSAKGVGLDPRRPARPAGPGPPRRPLGPSLGDDWPPDWGPEKKTKSNNWKAKKGKKRGKKIELGRAKKRNRASKKGKKFKSKLIHIYRLVDFKDLFELQVLTNLQKCHTLVANSRVK